MINTDIKRLGYQPGEPYPLDLEIFTMADLRQRGSRGKVQTTHRYEFHMLVCITQGTCTQLVDFMPISCTPGSLLRLHSGQAHNFGHDEDWDGWIVLFKPEFILPAVTTLYDARHVAGLEKLPEHIVLCNQELQRVAGLIQQMREDTKLDASHDDVHRLLRYQLHALLMRLSILQGRQQNPEPASLAIQRSRQFQQLVEERFTQWHRVSDYASQLGYTEKSLARAMMASVGTTAKNFITARINLEAKRLLVHTGLPVTTIAWNLGFEEATYFSKFFRRETGCTPVEFRQRYSMPR